MSDHPGGLKAIKNYIFKDVTNILFEVYPHKRDTTVAKLMKFQVGLIPEEEVKKPKQKTEKSIINPDKTKEKKKVCFNGDNETLKASIRVNKSAKTEALKHTQQLSRHKENINQSTNKSKISKSSKSKCKKKENLTSIRLLSEDISKTYDDYFNDNQEKIREKERAQTDKKSDRKEKGLNGTCSFLNNEIDEEKPNFRIPILFVKHMNRHN